MTYSTRGAYAGWSEQKKGSARQAIPLLCSIGIIWCFLSGFFSIWTWITHDFLQNNATVFMVLWSNFGRVHNSLKLAKAQSTMGFPYRLEESADCWEEFHLAAKVCWIWCYVFSNHHKKYHQGNMKNTLGSWMMKLGRIFWILKKIDDETVHVI